MSLLRRTCAELAWEQQLHTLRKAADVRHCIGAAAGTEIVEFEKAGAAGAVDEVEIEERPSTAAGSASDSDSDRKAMGPSAPKWARRQKALSALV